MRAFKIAAVVATVILSLAASGALLLWLDGGRVVGWTLRHPISAIIARQIRIGRLDVRWGVPTHIIAENVHIANTSWGSAPEIFSAEKVEVDIIATSLLWGPTVIRQLTLDGANLLLETSTSGEHNWDLALRSAVPQKRHQFPVLQHFVARRSALTYRNGETEAATSIDIDSMEVGMQSPQAPVTIAAMGKLKDHPFHLAGMVGPLADLRNPQQPYPLRLDGGIDRVRFVADGTMAEPLDLAGVDLRLSVEGAKLHEIGAFLGVPLPELPDFRGTTQLAGGNGKWSLNALTMALGHSDLEGGIDVDTTAKVPHVTANLTSHTLDLVDFKGVYGGQPAHASAPIPQAEPNGRVLPDTPLAVHKLPGINAELTFDGTQIKSTVGAPLERVSLGLQLKDGALAVRPLRFHAANGDVDLDFHFTPFTKDTPPRLQANVDVRHVDLHKLLGGPDRPAMLQQTAGVIGGFAKINTTGVSLRQFLTRMNGEAGLFLENGRISQLLEQIIPLNVLSALGIYVSGDKPVPIHCLVSQFDIKAGIAGISTLLLDTADTVVTAEGSVNFPSETFFITLSPHNKNFTLVALRVPVDLHGTFSQPIYNFRRGDMVRRLGEALGLVPLVDVGLGEGNQCSKVISAQESPAEGKPPKPTIDKRQ
jgi:AsmA family protein